MINIISLFQKSNAETSGEPEVCSLGLLSIHSGKALHKFFRRINKKLLLLDESNVLADTFKSFICIPFQLLITSSLTESFTGWSVGRSINTIYRIFCVYSCWINGNFNI